MAPQPWRDYMEAAVFKNNYAEQLHIFVTLFSTFFRLIPTTNWFLGFEFT